MKTYLSKYSSFVVVSHTLFSFPFVLVGYVMSLSEGFRFGSNYKLLLIFTSTFTLRNAAMGFNRLVDATFDGKNSRTALREIPRKIISKKEARFFILIHIFFFFLSTYFINILCFSLASIALVVTLGYSYLKRVSSLTHFVLGLGLALAPAGAYLAVTEHLSWGAVMLSCAVLFWVAGFDILYAMQDREFDRSHRLHSIPAKFGFRSSYLIALCCELASVAFLVLLGLIHQPPFGVLFWVGVGIFAAIILFQFSRVNEHHLHIINRQFAVFNGWSSVLFSLCFLLDFNLPSLL